MSYLTIALPKGRLGEQAIKTFSDANISKVVETKSRKLVFVDHAKKLKFILLKNSDIVTYVENQTADIGIVGSDLLKENKPKLYELYNFSFGKCKMCLCGLKGINKESDYNYSKVASKYPNICKDYLSSISDDSKIIKINGSVELAPLLGLAEVIVDVVETGSTLKANGLEVYTELFEINPVLVVNQISYKFNKNTIDELTQKIEESENKND